MKGRSQLSVTLGPQAHYQYLLFLRNTFDRAAASAGADAAARRLADAMCQESRTLRRVLDVEVDLDR